jgi:AraC-like DNA-binding protein
MARPEKPIDWELVDRFLEAGCNQKQICSSIGISEDTLQRRFKDKYGVAYSVYAVQKAQYGEALLLEAQMRKALEGNTQMLIWLGRNRLKQTDAPTEANISDQTMSKFTELMAAITSSQSKSDFKIADNNNNIDQ